MDKHVCAIMNNDRTDEHEQQAHGARAMSMPACIDQTSIFKALRNKQAEHHWQREYMTAYCTYHHHTRQATTETCGCMNISSTRYAIKYYVRSNVRLIQRTRRHHFTVSKTLRSPAHVLRTLRSPAMHFDLPVFTMIQQGTALRR